MFTYSDWATGWTRIKIRFQRRLADCSPVRSAQFNSAAHTAVRTIGSSPVSPKRSYHCPSGAEIKNAWSCLHYPIRLHFAVLSLTRTSLRHSKCRVYLKMKHCSSFPPPSSSSYTNYPPVYPIQLHEVTKSIGSGFLVALGLVTQAVVISGPIWLKTELGVAAPQLRSRAWTKHRAL